MNVLTVKKVFLILPLFFALAACSTATNIVSDPVKRIDNVQSIRLVEAEPTIDVPQAVRDHMNETLRNELFTEQGFQEGDDLTIEYRFVSFKSGNQLKRFLSDGLGNWGEGSLAISSKFISEDGEVLGSIDTRGKVESGILGGVIKSAASRVAEQVAEYTGSSFKR